MTLYKKSQYHKSACATLLLLLVLSILLFTSCGSGSKTAASNTSVSISTEFTSATETGVDSSTTSTKDSCSISGTEFETSLTESASEPEAESCSSELPYSDSELMAASESESTTELNSEFITVSEPEFTNASEAIASSNSDSVTVSNSESEASAGSDSSFESKSNTNAVSGSKSTSDSNSDTRITYDITLAFAGDINLDDDWYVMQYAAQQPNGIEDCIAEELIAAMWDADLCCINNEFSFSTRGSAMENKAFTFRSNPANVSLLTDLGVDLATLANNHIYDYGADAFADTLTTLEDAGIAYVGAGMDLEEAMEPYYYTKAGVTIAVVNATRAEKYVMTPAATASSSGVLRCYDTTLFEQVIAEAAENADFVVCCVHWGTENTYELESVQKETARLYIDAGADVIIGTHTHCLQGIEYYKGKPIFYSLGNFWFNAKTVETGLLVLHVTGNTPGNPTLSCAFIPAIQEGCVTRYAESTADREAVFGLLNEISVNAEVDSEGNVHEVN